MPLHTLPDFSSIVPSFIGVWGLCQQLEYDQSFTDRIDDIRIDEVLSDGDTLTVGDLQITALETPGHTRCCMSHSIRQAGLLVCSETIGEWIGGKLLPGFVASYSLALQSIRRCAALNPGRIIVPHLGELPADNVAGFFEHATEIAGQAAAFVRQRHESGMETATIVQEFIEKHYGTESGLLEQAILLNTNAMVSKLL